MGTWILETGKWIEVGMGIEVIFVLCLFQPVYCPIGKRSEYNFNPHFEYKIRDQNRY